MKNSNLKYILIFFGFILLVDIVAGLFYRYKFDSISYSFYGNINNSLKSNSEVLILGSSRALHHYKPTVVTDSLKLTCYNSGTGGYGLFLNYAVLSERIETKKSPKVVILDLAPNTMIIGQNSYSKLDKLLPYYKKSESFKEIILLNDEFSKLKLVSNLYIYNSTLYDFIKNDLGESETGNGYSPINQQLDAEKLTPFFLESNDYFDENKMAILQKIITLCQKNNIKLFGVVSPTYIKFDKENRIIDKIDSIFNESNTDFFDYSNFSNIYGKPKYFKDQLHMNNLGAEIFSKELMHKILANTKK